jgi:hypothetical protein
MKKNKKNDVILAFKKANRDIEMERNGYRWIAIDRPHKNKKKYNRKNNKKELSNEIDSSFYLWL